MSSAIYRNTSRYGVRISNHIVQRWSILYSFQPVRILIFLCVADTLIF